MAGIGDEMMNRLRQIQYEGHTTSLMKGWVQVQGGALELI